MTAKWEFENIAKLLQPYYDAGLTWETRGEALYVEWGKTRCIGIAGDVACLSAEKMDVLLDVWFSGHKEWAMREAEERARDA